MSAFFLLRIEGGEGECIEENPGEEFTGWSAGGAEKMEVRAGLMSLCRAESQEFRCLLIGAQSFERIDELRPFGLKRRVRQRFEIQCWTRCGGAFRFGGRQPDEHIGMLAARL